MLHLGLKTNFAEHPMIKAN